MDALLGPKVSADAGEKTTVKSKNSMVQRDLGKQQAKIKDGTFKGFVVRPMSESEKEALKNRRPQRPRSPKGKEEEEEGAETPKRYRALTDEEVKRELKEAARLLEMDEEQESDVSVKKRRKSNNSVTHDGTENPATFSVDMGQFGDPNSLFGISGRFGPGGDLDQLDQKIPTSEYYRQKFYPVSALASIVTFGGQKPLNHCELAFVVTSKWKGEHWWRNQRFNSTQDLSNFIQRVQPVRIEIGPTHPNSDTKVDYSKRNLLRQLVFDLDLEDRGEEHEEAYIRNCQCKGKKAVCGAGCWFYMVVGVKVLTYLLRTSMGYKHIMPVYSGRRGVHIWVMDQDTLELTTEDRAQIAQFITGKYGNPNAYWHPEHSSYIYKFILLPAFQAHFLAGQCLLAAPATISVLLEMAKEAESAQKVLLQTLAYVHHQSPEALADTWKDLCIILGTLLGHLPRHIERNFVFKMFFPRLDHNVTVQLQHPIKAPWVVHPTTKRLSVPIPNIDTWKPEDAPRISQIVELDDEKANVYGQWEQRRAREERQAMGSILSQYVAPVTYMIQKAYPMRGWQPITIHRPAPDREDEIDGT